MNRDEITGLILYLVLQSALLFIITMTALGL